MTIAEITSQPNVIISIQPIVKEQMENRLFYFNGWSLFRPEKQCVAYWRVSLNGFFVSTCSSKKQAEETGKWLGKWLAK